jgi:AcrR family transcriptional regulator
MDPSSTDSALPLRERKKRRTRRELSEAALRLFLEHGYEATTLDDLVAAVEVSKRTFFRNYPSKDAVALAAETDLWDAYVATLEDRGVRGNVLGALRDALTATLSAMGDEWLRRFLATRGLIARTPALRDRSELVSLAARRRIVETLADQLAIDDHDVRLRLLGELALGAWRCGAQNWVRGGKRTRSRRIAGLIREVESAFAAVPDAVGLTAVRRRAG